jgi:hypothetical protein
MDQLIKRRNMTKKIYLSNEDIKAPEEWTEEAKKGAKIAGSIGLSLDDLDDSGDMAEELRRIMYND